MSLFTCLMARFYDRGMSAIETGALGEWRSDLLSSVQGRVLEIGAGTGANLSYYPDNLDGLILSEPDPHFRRRLANRLQSDPRADCRLSEAESHVLDVDAGSVDVVVSTLVLCSVPDLSMSLHECHRVLRPGGRLVVVEHVAAELGSARSVVQLMLDPVHRVFAGGCRLRRRTEDAICEAGFAFSDLSREDLRPAPVQIRSCIRGVAVRS